MIVKNKDGHFLYGNIVIHNKILVTSGYTERVIIRSLLNLLALTIILPAFSSAFFFGFTCMHDKVEFQNFFIE